MLSYAGNNICSVDIIRIFVFSNRFEQMGFEPFSKLGDLHHHPNSNQCCDYDHNYYFGIHTLLL